MLPEGRNAELEALDPLYEAWDDVSVHAHLDQWWAVRVTAAKGTQSVVGTAHGRSFLEALRVAAACALRAADADVSQCPAPGPRQVT